MVIGGVEQKAHCFVIDLPHSYGCFISAVYSFKSLGCLQNRGALPKTLAWVTTPLDLVANAPDSPARVSSTYSQI